MTVNKHLHAVSVYWYMYTLEQYIDIAIYREYNVSNIDSKLVNSDWG